MKRRRSDCPRCGRFIALTWYGRILDHGWRLLWVDGQHKTWSDKCAGSGSVVRAAASPLDEPTEDR